MLLLTTTSTLLRLVTNSAGDIEVAWSGVDANGTTFTPVGGTPANISTATTTTIVAAPASSTQRNVKDLNIANNHASNSNTLTIEQYDGTNAVVRWRGTLLAQERLVFDEAGQWTVYGSDGIPKTVAQLLELLFGAVGSGTVPAAPADAIKLFARKLAGRMTPKWIGPYGVDHVFQDKLSENGASLYLPNNGTTVGLNLGLAWTTGGTVSHPTPSSTSPAIYSQQKRTRWANVVTTTNQVLGLRTATAEKRYWRGNAAGLGGWSFHARFAVGLWPAATVRLFVGLNDSNSGWVVSDTLTGHGCGFWHDTTDAATVLSFVTRDGTTATKAAITLATALAAGQCFDAWIWSAPNGGSIGYRLQELNTGTVLVETTTTTTLPGATAFLGQELAMSNGTANTTVTTTAFELCAHACESDI
jgi:hypothetical protein